MTVAISCLVTDRLRYVMIVSIPDTIPYQEVERKLFLKKTYGEVLNLKVKAIIARERILNIKVLPIFFHTSMPLYLSIGLLFNHGNILVERNKVAAMLGTYISHLSNTIL